LGKDRVHVAVVLPIRIQFVTPKSGAGAGWSVMDRTSMPEAAIHEDRHTFAEKGEIRLSGKGEMPPPTCQAVPPE
jgi:hypothetical protein